MTEKPSTTLLGTVDKIVTPVDPGLPEKVQITLQDVDGVPQQIRIENTLTSENGNEVTLNKGAVVKITIKRSQTL
jgi:hypothetical protein